jgi:hypothetical protein
MIECLDFRWYGRDQLFTSPARTEPFAKAACWRRRNRRSGAKWARSNIVLWLPSPPACLGEKGWRLGFTHIYHQPIVLVLNEMVLVLVLEGVRSTEYGYRPTGNLRQGLRGLSVTWRAWLKLINLMKPADTLARRNLASM